MSGPDERLESEYFWIILQPFLASVGYTLRPRYQPDWVPSWTRGKKTTKTWKCEDNSHILNWSVLDATRSDGSKVVLKAIETLELAIGTYLSSEKLLDDTRNHCVPILDVIPVPGQDNLKLIVMPFLRRFYHPHFHCRAELVEAFKQILEGLEFMHRHHVAHRDLSLLNIMMDSSRVVPSGFHMADMFSQDRPTLDVPIESRHRCRVGPVKYYIIDFGLSSWFPEGHEGALVTGVVGQTKVVPELSDTVPYDPFKVDIIQLGAALKSLLKDYSGVDDFHPLLQRMTAPAPNDRPSAAEALTEFESLVEKIDDERLRARIWVNFYAPPSRFARYLEQKFPSALPYLYPDY